MYIIILCWPLEGKMEVNNITLSNSIFLVFFTECLEFEYCKKDGGVIEKIQNLC